MKYSICCVFEMKHLFTVICYSQLDYNAKSCSAEPFQNKTESFNKCYAARVSPLMNHLLGQTDVVARVLSHSAKAGESFPRSPGVLEAP